LISLCNCFDSRAHDERKRPFSWCKRRMAFEQIVTILLGTTLAAAAILYAIRPRRTDASQPAAVSNPETVSLPSQSVSDTESFETPISVTATESTAAEVQAEVVETSPAPVATMPSEVATTSSSDAAPQTADVPAFQTPSATLASRSSTTPRSHRAPRRSSVSSRTTAKPRAPAGSRAAIRKDQA